MSETGKAALADMIWAIVKKDIRKDRRKQIAEQLIKALQGDDRGTLEESKLWDVAEFPRYEDKWDE